MPRFAVFAVFTVLLAAAMAAPPDVALGKALFESHCAVCHKPVAENRTPTPEALARFTREAIVAALSTGSMKEQGSALTIPQREAIAAFLSAGAIVETPRPANACVDSKAALKGLRGWNGWGVDMANTRFQSEKAAGLRASDVPELKLKWAFGMPHATGVMYGQPTIADGSLFLGSNDGTVYALDARTGCVHWTFKAESTVRSAISLGASGGRVAAYFGDVKANAYALDASNGELLWKVHVENHPLARVTGAPKLFEGRLYVPVSSVEEVAGGNPKYPCCTFRGSIVALNAADGKQIWKTYSIQDAPAPTGKSPSGADLFGPAGGAIWSSPTIDPKRRALYVGSGNQYSDPPSPQSDALLAMDLNTGKLLWSKQLAKGDGWNFGCLIPAAKGSCPQTMGPDVDIGSSPVLRRAGGKDLLIVGQKSGVVHALNPDEAGEVVWQVRVGKGGALGGVMWGSAADENNIYVPLSDWAETAKDAPPVGGGLFALKLASGDKVWFTPPEKPACVGRAGCTPSQMAPTTVIPGVVFSGSMDGHLRAYSTADGRVLWDFDTLKDFDTVNGVPAKGGSLSATGPTIADGMLFVNSGYGALGGMPGNVLLAFGK